MSACINSQKLSIKDIENALNSGKNLIQYMNDFVDKQRQPQKKRS